MSLEKYQLLYHLISQEVKLRNGLFPQSIYSPKNVFELFALNEEHPLFEPQFWYPTLKSVERKRATLANKAVNFNQ